MLILLSIPGVAVILFTLWLNHDAAIENSKHKVVRIARHLIVHQQNMINDVKRLTLYLAKQQSGQSDVPSTCPSYFLDFQTLFDSVANIGVTNAAGDVLCTTHGQTNNINISDREYFQRAINNQKFTIGHFQHDRSLHTPSINFAYPIIDENHNLQGTLVTTIALNSWNLVLDSADISDDTQVVITDSNQVILANYPHMPKRLGKKISSQDIEHNQALLTPFTGDDGVSRILHREAIYQDQYNNNLNIYIALPVDNIITQVNGSFIKILSAFISAIIILTLVARRLLQSSLFIPIARLTAATDSLALGKMPNHNEQPNSPELNTLYQHFKHMAETRLHAEANLQHKHDELTSLLSALPDNYLRINAVGEILNISGQFKVINAAQTEHNLTLTQLFSAANAQLILEHLPTTDLASSIEFTVSKNASVSSYEARISPLKNQQEFVVVIRDISERKANEEALHLASLVYNNSSEGMAITDQNGIIHDVNPAFCSTTLFSKEDVIGQPSSILSSGKHDQRFYNAMWSELTATGRWQGEITNRRKNGELYVEWLTIDTIYDEHHTAIRRIAIFTDLTEKKQADELIWRQARFDHLTDLPNRIELKERLNQYFTNGLDAKKELVVMLVDIDHFKDINDTLGHYYGDNLLKLLSLRLIDSVRNAEFVARIGGDEFVIIFNKVNSLTHAKQLAKNILATLASPFQIENEEIYVSASIGIACAPSDGDSTEQLLKAADQAMYKVKNTGRNGFAFFSKDMREKAQARMLLLKDLRSAVELNQFALFYQPIVCLKTLQIHKAEGLIRWQHPEKGLISPADFIPLAEETRQINAIGEFVFAQALHMLSILHTQINDEFQISINVSPIQLSTPDSGIDDWATKLKAAQLPAAAIVAEITEGLMVNPEALTQQRLKALVKSGMQLALDDFGTGYSSLAYLQEMDTDFLKIDKRFVDNIHKGSRELALCEAIIVMAHQLGLKVIAEGIETQQQMQLLLDAGCDYGQGYLFAKPLAKNDFMQLLSKSPTLL